MSEFPIEDAVEIIVNAYQQGQKVLICGNGGLAAESEHFAAEMVGKYGKDIFLPCIALTANSSIITAIANDLGYEQVFAHQVKVVGKPDDVLIAMTTSSSKNIRLALAAGQSKGLKTICLCAADSPELGANLTIRTKSNYGIVYVQEEILKLLHALATKIKMRF